MKERFPNAPLNLSDEDFRAIANEKGELARIINHVCKSMGASWLVLNEEIEAILVEVRFLDAKQKYELSQKVFDYVDSTILDPSRPYVASQRSFRAGKGNSNVRFLVTWVKRGVA